MFIYVIADGYIVDVTEDTDARNPESFWRADEEPSAWAVWFIALSDTPADPALPVAYERHPSATRAQILGAWAEAEDGYDAHKQIRNALGFRIPDAYSPPTQGLPAWIVPVDSRGERDPRREAHQDAIDGLSDDADNLAAQAIEEWRSFGEAAQPAPLSAESLSELLSACAHAIAARISDAPAATDPNHDARESAIDARAWIQGAPSVRAQIDEAGAQVWEAACALVGADPETWRGGHMSSEVIDAL